MKSRGILCLLFLTTALLALAACGGGGVPLSDFTSDPLEIVSPAELPPAVEGKPYSATLSARNVSGALSWRITRTLLNNAPVDLTPSTGLTLDGPSGRVSGIPVFGGKLTLTVQANDSRARNVTKDVSVSSYPPLTKHSDIALTSLQQFRSFFGSEIAVEGGVPPLRSALVNGSLPSGVKFDQRWRAFGGTPLEQGNFQADLMISDSFSPPQSVTVSVNVVVGIAPLTLAPSLPGKLVQNVPFQGRLTANGGMPPYMFSIFSGALPSGLLFESASGRISGTPSVQGDFSFTAKVADSQSPRVEVTQGFGISVTPPRPRNDSVATATRISSESEGSISPYIDPPNGVPFPGDIDYYKLRASGGTTVRLEVVALGSTSEKSLDTVLELVDGNNQRLTTCRQPGDTSEAFSSECLNDDVSAIPHVQNSKLEFRVPGSASDAPYFYARVFDWRGDARPDMRYRIVANGAVRLLTAYPSASFDPRKGMQSSFLLSSEGGLAPVTWSLKSGSLPPGMSLDPAGIIKGTPTTVGTYQFRVVVTDAGNPPEQANVDVSVFVRE